MRSTDVRRIGASLVAVAGGVALAALAFIDIPPAPVTTGLTPPTTAVPPGPEVIVIGDSITERSRERVATELVRRGWNTAVRARDGAQINDLRSSLRGADTLRPRAIVIELGSNDVGRGGAGAAVDRIGRTLRDVSAIACVVWVNVTEWTNFFGYDTRAGGPVFNRALAAAALDDKRLHIVDYAGLFRPDTAERAAALAADFDVLQLHPQAPAAVEAWVTSMGETVDRFCRP